MPHGLMQFAEYSAQDPEGVGWKVVIAAPYAATVVMAHRPRWLRWLPPRDTSWSVTVYRGAGRQRRGRYRAASQVAAEELASAICASVRAGGLGQSGA